MYVVYCFEIASYKIAGMISFVRILQSLKINTAEWDLGDFDTKDPYLPYFIKVYGKANIANALLTNYEFNIDPIAPSLLQRNTGVFLELLFFRTRFSHSLGTLR